MKHFILPKAPESRKQGAQPLFTSLSLLGKKTCLLKDLELTQLGAGLAQPQLKLPAMERALLWQALVCCQNPSQKLCCACMHNKYYGCAGSFFVLILFRWCQGVTAMVPSMSRQSKMRHSRSKFPTSWVWRHRSKLVLLFGLLCLLHLVGKREQWDYDFMGQTVWSSSRAEASIKKFHNFILKQIIVQLVWTLFASGPSLLWAIISIDLFYKLWIICMQPSWAQTEVEPCPPSGSMGANDWYWADRLDWRMICPGWVLTGFHICNEKVR